MKKTPKELSQTTSQEQIEVEEMLLDESKQDYSEEEQKKVSDYWNEWGASYIDHFTKNLYSITSNVNEINRWASRNASYNPPTAQDYTQSINISPKLPDASTLKQYLASPATHQKDLRDVSQYLQNVIMQYQRTTDYLTKIMALNSDLRALDEPEKSEDIQGWKNGYSRCKKFLSKFNARHQFNIVLQKVAEEGGYFAYLQEKEEFATLIEIPSDWCYITGRWDWGWTYAIDLAYYDQLIGIVEVTPELTRYYEKFIRMRTQGLRGSKLAPYQYYSVPIDKGYVFTHNPLRAQIVPPMKGTFLDANAILDYKNLLKNKMLLDTVAIISQQIPMDKEGKPSMDYKIAQAIVSATSTVLGKQVATFATPFKTEKMEFNNTQNQNNWVGFGENEYWRTSGVGASIMDMTDSNAIAQKYSIMNDFGFMEHLYFQFENFLNIQLHLKSRKYRFRVRYYGNKYTESEDMKDYAQLVTGQNMPIGKLYGLAGYEPYEVDSIIKQEDILGWRNVQAILPASQMSGKEETGRPSKDLNEMTDGGIKQAGYDSNNTSMKT